MGDFVLADTAFNDFSICDDFDLDLAYGKNENDFTLTVPLGRKIPYGTYAFYDESDWGGTIDSSSATAAGHGREYSTRRSCALTAVRTTFPILETSTTSLPSSSPVRARGQCSSRLPRSQG